MGGGGLPGGGFNPFSLISSMVFSTAMNALNSPQQTQGQASGQAEAEAQAEARAAADQAAQLAEDNLRADRQRRQAEVLARNKAQQRASLASQSALAQTLGAPAVDTSKLKEKLGQ